MKNTLHLSFFLSATLIVSIVLAKPPPLPFTFWGSWAVMTQNNIAVNGSTNEIWSVGQHVSVGSDMRCRYGVQDLFPTVHEYTTVSVANYTGGEEYTRIERDDGTTTNCTIENINGTLPFGGAWYLAPRMDIFPKMVFSTYTLANGFNCSIWQFMGDNPDAPGMLLIQWYIRVEDNVPQVMLNQTFVKDPSSGNMTSVIFTTAFNGYDEITDWPQECTKPNLCGTDFCAANMYAGTAALESAIQWVCGVENCDPIGQQGQYYLPNTDIAHGTWAFEQYYLNNMDQGASACDFGGAASFTTCPTGCSMCNVSSKATDAQLEAALSWVCGPQGIQDCSSIQPGGNNFLPNTTQAHCSWAFNVYYQGYKCVPGLRRNACNFNGSAVIVSC